MPHPRSAPRRLNAMCVGKLIAYLMDVPSNINELAEVSGLSIPTARRFVLSLHREGAIRTVSWEEDRLGRYATRVYAFGRGQDVARPNPARKRAAKKRDARAKQLQVQMQNALVLTEQA